MLAIRYGARRLLAISAFGWSLLTLLTPEASHSDVIILCRILMGVFEGTARVSACKHP
jgi:MFS family permease